MPRGCKIIDVQTHAHAQTHPQSAIDNNHYDAMMDTLFRDYKDAMDGSMALEGYQLSDSPFEKEPFVSAHEHAEFVRGYVRPILMSCISVSYTYIPSTADDCAWFVSPICIACMYVLYECAECLVKLWLRDEN